jgi:murein DD-endopeptidase MepM/ murein hydrolase activator NlpD
MPEHGSTEEIDSPDSGNLITERLRAFSNRIIHGTQTERLIRIGTHALMVALILLVALGMREFYLRAEIVNPLGKSALAAEVAEPTPTETFQGLPPLKQYADNSPGVKRRARLHTDVPSRPRNEVFKYTVKEGDTLIGIADKFGLKPETILWSNQFVLGDNPHNIIAGQEINILPVDGAYHKWSAGDGLNGVAKFFNVSPEVIIEFPGNNLSQDEIGDWANPNIEPGLWLVIPGGEREFVSWSAPVIPIDDPSVAKVLGPGACESVTAGAVGAGVFIRPVDNYFISGYDYNPDANHSGIDLDGDEGDPVYAIDNGVVVYAGWNKWGYGNVIVINHGNGWQSLYAHLSGIYVGCGASVWQTNVIGAVGNTGRSSGPHLHFEMMYEGVRVNPKDYIR